MPDPDRTQILKVLSGLHTGAKASLTSGHYVIGSSDECDIILSDSGVADRHLRLDIAPGAVSISPLDGRTLVNGNNSVADGTVLDDFECVSLGNAVFAVGPADTPWPDIALPGAVPVSDGKAPPDDGGMAGAPTGKQRQKSDIGASSQPSPEPRKSRKFIRAFLLVQAVMALVIIILLMSHLFQDNRPPKVPITDVDKRELLQKLASKYHIQIPRITINNMGIPLLSGYVNSSSERKALRSALSGAGFTVYRKIYVQDEMINNMRDMLSMNHLDINKLNISATKAGVFEISGVCKDMKALDKALAIIKTDIAGVRGITAKVTAARIQEQSLYISKTPPPAPKPKPEPEPEQEAKPKPEPEPKLGLANNGPFSLSRLSPEVVAIHVGPVSYLSTAKGDKIFPGGRLKSGVIVLDINSDHVLVNDAGNIVKFDFGGK